MVIPPPLMQERAYGMNWTVINSVYPGLATLIQQANKVHGPIDIFTGMGGVPDWQTKFPANASRQPPCPVSDVTIPVLWSDASADGPAGDAV